jgi:hypothetical protein
MNQALPPFAPTPPDAHEADPPRPAARYTTADDVMTAYVNLLAGCFQVGQLAAGRRLNRSGVHTNLLNDA